MLQVIHGNLATRVVVDSKRLPWTASPIGTVWRKRMHLVGPVESGQVTSLVRFDANARFPRHDHPEGEEILVLANVFSDEHGDWPARSYLLNPEGFSHAPYSSGGCLLFVKLRQYPGNDRRHIATNTDELVWQPIEGRWRKVLYQQTGYRDTTCLERWPPGWSSNAVVAYPEGAELLVLGGSFADEHGLYDEHTWMRLPAGATHQPRTVHGCELYIKRGALAYLRSGE